jgi:hypothetical protein
MPTLDDTIEFQATTLNDLLEAEAGTGTAVGAADDRYRRWAFLATGAAGILAVLFVVTMLTGGGTGGGGGGGGGKPLDLPKDKVRVAVTVNESLLTSDILKNGAIVSVRSDDGSVLASGATVLSFERQQASLGRKPVKLEVAAKPDEREAIQSQLAQGHLLTVESGVAEKAVTPAPAPTPAPGG